MDLNDLMPSLAPVTTRGRSNVMKDMVSPRNRVTDRDRVGVPLDLAPLRLSEPEGRRPKAPKPKPKPKVRKRALTVTRDGIVMTRTARKTPEEQLAHEAAMWLSRYQERGGGE